MFRVVHQDVRSLHKTLPSIQTVICESLPIYAVVIKCMIVLIMVFKI